MIFTENHGLVATIKYSQYDGEMIDFSFRNRFCFFFAVLLGKPARIRYAGHVGKLKGTKKYTQNFDWETSTKKDHAGGDDDDDGWSVRCGTN
jgi:hypothetical protein